MWWWNWKYVMESLDDQGIDKRNKWVESKKKKKLINADIYHFPGNQMRKLNSILTFIQWEERR